MPALRARGADVRLLAEHYAGELCRGLGIGKKKMGPEFSDTLMAYDWPGNVRELINVLQSALVQSLDDDVLYPQVLPLELRLRHLQRSFGPGDSEKAPAEPFPKAPEAPIGDILPPYQQFRRQTERRYLQQLMAAARGRIPRACEISGLSRARIYQMLAKHDLKPRKDSSYNR